MSRLLTLAIATAALVASSGPANAQYYYGYQYGAQVYIPPNAYAFGYPRYNYGYYPGVNQTVISVTPYWRPLVVNTPVVSTSIGPNYYYSNAYSFRTNPYGYHWSASRYQWVDGGMAYAPPLGITPYGYPGYAYPNMNPDPAPAPAVVPAVAATRFRITRGFVPVTNPLTGDYALPEFTTTPTFGSFTPWGAYIPRSGTYVNPFATPNRE